jgi:hypothetical protein
MTYGQSASLSWCQAPIWGPRPDSYYCQTVAGLLMCGALSDKRTGLSFTIAAGTHQHGHSRVSVPRDSWPYFPISDSRLSHSGGPGPCIYIPQVQNGPVTPQGNGSPFFHLLWPTGLRWRYIQTHLHGGTMTNFAHWPSLYSLSMNHIENFASKSSFIVSCLFIAPETCLPCCCRATAVSFLLHYTGFQPSCNNIFSKVLLYALFTTTNDTIMVYKFWITWTSLTLWLPSPTTEVPARNSMDTGSKGSYTEKPGSRDSSVGIATGYGLDDRGVWVWVLVG